MRHLTKLGRIVALLIICALAVSPVSAQDSTPTATCVAPDVPPGTPTPTEEESPEAATEGEEHDHAASPEAGEAEEEAPVEEMGLPVGNPADAATTDRVTAAMQNLIACVNNGEYLKTGALATQQFIQEFLGVPTIYDVPASFEGSGPFDVRSLGNVLTYDDGSVSIDFVYGGFYNGPGGLSSERWFFVQEDGLDKVSNILQIPLPEGVLPGAHVVEVTMVDFAFALSETTLPADTPLIFRVTNASSAAGHVAVVLSFPEGTTSEGVITGEVDAIEDSTGFFGAIFLEPGQTGDFGLLGLAPGTYFLGCDVTTDAGTPHYELGMVAQFTVA